MAGSVFVHFFNITLMKHILLQLSLSVLLLASCGCKSSDTTGTNNNTTNDDGGKVPTAINTMDVTVNGTAFIGWSAIAQKVTSSGSTSINVVGSDVTVQGLTFTLRNISTTGTYDVGLVLTNGTTVSDVIMTCTTQDGNGAPVLYANPPAETESVGKLTVTELTATSIKATFHATLPLRNGNGPSTVTITKGGVYATIM